MDEKITVKVSQKEIELKETLVKEIIRRDLRLFDMYIIKNYIHYNNEVKSPITVKIYDNFNKHKGRTAFTIEKYYDLENHISMGIGDIINIEMNFSPFPPLECIEKTAHHEAAHIIKFIKRGDIGEIHDSIFKHILKQLDKNHNKDICTECSYANKRIYVEKEDE